MASSDNAPPLTVMTVDDHALLRAGIAAVLESQPDIRLVAEAASGLEAIAAYRRHQPDVTLMDLRMPDMDGIEAMLQIRREFPAARIVILTTYEGDAQALRAIKAGARGYLLKGALRLDLVETLRTVAAGGMCIPGEVAQAIARHAGDELLSPREIQVLRLVALGRTNKRLGEELFISEETVKGHVRNILAKLNASDRTHAVTIALKRGIIDS
ncbi:MAG TPA: response regulator transcription factor [Ideonella sp.]|nr:response regulator transcription factor [Ideonella sp.]